jgi:hypothetical protein
MRTDTSDVVVALQEDIKELRKLIDEQQIERGFSKSETERNYRIAAQKLTLELTVKGIKVTTIDSLVKGDPKVANLRFERDKAQVLYDNTIEHINALKLEIRVMSAYLNYEWSLQKYE